MTIAFWTILAAALLPMGSAAIAKAGAKDFDNAAPRAWLAAQGGWRARANWAQQNHLEAFPPFAAAVIVASIAGARHSWVNALALAFIALRLAYTAAYIFDQPRVRSLIFTLGFACVIALFGIAA